jgi:hypothetical protein
LSEIQDIYVEDKQEQCREAFRPGEGATTVNTAKMTSAERVLLR